MVKTSYHANGAIRRIDSLERLHQASDRGEGHAKIV